jgi:hypothetical protein
VMRSPLIPAQAGTQALSTTENTKNTDTWHALRARHYNSHFSAFRAFRGSIGQRCRNGAASKNTWVPADAGMSGVCA